MDYLIDLVDTASDIGDFDFISKLLEMTKVDYILDGPDLVDSIDIIFSLLNSTYPNKLKIASREDFYNKVSLKLNKMSKDLQLDDIKILMEEIK